MLDLKPSQRQIVEAPLDTHLFVCGRAGTGKTTAGVERLRNLLARGVPADSILMLAPQRTLQEPYLNLIYSPERGAGGEVTSATIGGLARRMCDLFWPLAAQAAGFRSPELPPVFLTLETAQYYMAFLVRPLLERGHFDAITIDRNRLYSQILDNLNKAAVVGFPHTEIGSRLDSAWYGDPAQRRIYADTQECASLFRKYCLEHNLLDFSLQMEVFNRVLWPQAQVREHLFNTYHHLIYDNLEEDTPAAHDILREWLPQFDSALLLYDENAGHRYFLGGDALTGRALSGLCSQTIQLGDSLVSNGAVVELADGLIRALTAPQSTARLEAEDRAFDILTARFYPEMLDRVVNRIRELIESGLPAAEIVILAPYLSDALRFSITHRLDAAGIPWHTHRPSRALRDEPASRILMTLSALAHPHWNIRPTKYDFAHTLKFALDVDLIRAQLLAEIVYHPKNLGLSTFDEINPLMRERITYSLGERYSMLRKWVMDYRGSNPMPLDFFLRRLFGELLSQPGYGFHRNMDAVRVAASLIESIRKFRYAMQPSYVELDSPAFDLGREYLAMLEEGVIAAQYLESWRTEEQQAILIAPAHTFLMMNTPVTVQFWLDPGSNGWVERPAQPLTQPYVLSRHWDAGRTWSDADELRVEVESLARLVGGLLSRCRERIILALADLGESGFEQRGILLRAFQRVLQNQES